MGLLSQGSPLSWEETQKQADHVRKHGILQFLHIYRAVRERHKDVLKWGDEVSGEERVPGGGGGWPALKGRGPCARAPVCTW